MLHPCREPKGSASVHCDAWAASGSVKSQTRISTGCEMPAPLTPSCARCNPAARSAARGPSVTQKTAVVLGATLPTPAGKMTVSSGGRRGSGYRPVPALLTVFAAVVTLVKAARRTSSAPRPLGPPLRPTPTPASAAALPERTAIWKVACSPRAALSRRAGPQPAAGAVSCWKTFSPTSANQAAGAAAASWWVGVMLSEQAEDHEGCPAGAAARPDAPSSSSSSAARRRMLVLDGGASAGGKVSRGRGANARPTLPSYPAGSCWGHIFRTSTN